MAGVLGGLIGSLAKLTEITHVGFSSGTLASGVAYPSGLQVGDVLFMLISSDNSKISVSNSTLASNNGFTTLYLSNFGVEGLVAYKVLTSVPSGTITGSEFLPVVLTAFRGVDTLLPIVTSARTDGDQAGMPDPPSISVSTNQMVLAIGFLDDDAIPAANILPPTGYTSAGSFSFGNDISAVMSAYKKITTSGTEDPGPFTENWSGIGDDANWAASVALRPIGG